jgi:ketosteroid isomerase-like protein
MSLTLIDRVAIYHDAMERQDLDAVAHMFTPDAEYHSVGVGAVYGRHAIMNAFARYFRQYPDQHAVDERLSYAGPDSVRSDWYLTATRQSDGRRIERRGTAIMFFDPKGLIRRIEVKG